MAIYASPVTYMLMRIHNAEKEHQDSISMESNPFLVDIAKCLREAGYIRNYRVIKYNSAKDKASQSKSTEPSALILYLAEGKKIPEITPANGRMIKKGAGNEIHLSMRDIKSPPGKISAARRSAIRRAVIMTAIKSMTETNSAPGK